MIYFLLFLSLLFTSCTSGLGSQRSYIISQQEAQKEAADDTEKE